MKILLAPGSFKGSLSAPEAAWAMARGIRRVRSEAEIVLLPMADGGEGTLDAVLAATGGERQEAVVSGADFRPLAAGYGIVEDEGRRTAVLEAARVVGLALAKTTPVGERSTVGLGELVRHCLDRGIRRFLIGLGGTGTNDGGAGLLVALGARLLDGQGCAVNPTPDGLERLAAVDFSTLDPRLKESGIVALADVDSPLCGESGATAVFGPQKGVAPQQIPVFDARLARLAELGDAWFGRRLSLEPGTGAAGGLGYALRLLGAEYRSGAEAVCDLLGFDAALEGADLVLTGEGRSDAQTLRGKAPCVVARHARRAGVPVILLSGAIDHAALPLLRELFDGCFSAAPETMPQEQAMREAAILLADAAERCLGD